MFFSRRIPRQVVVSDHIVRDRQDRLGERMTKEQIEQLIHRFGTYSKTPPYGVHQGNGSSDGWIGLDTGKTALAFPLIRKRDHQGNTAYLATTVIDRDSTISGASKAFRRMRIRSLLS